MSIEFTLKVRNVGEDGRMTTIKEKIFYNLDGIQSAAEWIREPNKSIKAVDAPQMMGPIKWKQDGRGKLIENALGYMHCNANNIYYNATLVGLYGSCFSAANGLSITDKNYWRVIALFTARKLIASDWINQKDEYMVPNTEHTDYQQWLNDALVYALFNTSSNQSSLRQIDYKNKKWNIINHFFFMDRSEMEKLAKNNNNNDVYNDCKSHPFERFTQHQLQSLKLSPDAQKVLDMARELVRKSFSLRTACQDISPEYHINTWDAGWYQIRNGLLKDNFKADYDDFMLKYKALEERLREGVYTFGFLRK